MNRGRVWRAGLARFGGQQRQRREGCATRFEGRRRETAWRVDRGSAAGVPHSATLHECRTGDPGRGTGYPRNARRSSTVGNGTGLHSRAFKSWDNYSQGAKDMRTLVLVFALVCGSCVVSHARVYRNPYIKTGIFSRFYYSQRYTPPRVYKQYGYRRYAQPYVRPRPYTRPWWVR